MEYYQDEKFENVSFVEEGFKAGEYEGCHFINCLLTQLNLAKSVFEDCTFDGCDLSMINLSGVSLRDVKFVNCKMTGVRFDHCNPILLSPSFNGCLMDLTSFYQCEIKSMVFKDCRLHEADFAEANLNEGKFMSCDLLNAVFDHTQLEKVDLSTSSNFTIDPTNNNLKNAKFNLQGLPGLLQVFDIEIV